MHTTGTIQYVHNACPVFLLQTNTARYAELDEDAMEQPLPAPLRYSAVEYADLNEVQPAARQE